MDRKSFKRSIIESVQIPEMPKEIGEYAYAKEYHFLKKNNHLKTILKIAFMVLLISLVIITGKNMVIKSNNCTTTINENYKLVTNYDGKEVNNVYITYILFSEKYSSIYDERLSANYDVPLANMVGEIYFVLLEEPVDKATTIIMEKYNYREIESLIKRVDRAMNDLVVLNDK